MHCPKCKSDTKVKDSRSSANNTIRRRRACLSCGYKFTTLEAIPRVRAVAEVTIKPKRLPHIKEKKKIRTIKKQIDYTDEMTDEELEAWIFSED
jgi:transcriptional repressor NrdR